MVANVPVQSTDHPPDAYPERDPGRSSEQAAALLIAVQSTVHPEPERFTIAQAATLLGTSRDAIRQRIRRGTLRSEKADGKWYVYLSEEPAVDEASRTDGLDNVPSDHPPTVQSARPTDDLYSQLIDQLRSEVTFLREELRRKDQLLAGLAQRIPALDAPQRVDLPLQSRPPDIQHIEADGMSPGSHEQTSPPPAPASRPWWKLWVRA